MKRTCVIARILWPAPGRPVVPLAPRHRNRGGRRADRRNLPSSARAHLRTRGAFRRAVAASSSVRAALCSGRLCSAFGLRSLWRLKGQPLLRQLRASSKRPPSASSSQQVLVPAGGVPAPPERMGYVSPRPRAPHRPVALEKIESASRPERRLAHLRQLAVRRSVLKTSLEDAPRSSGTSLG